MRGIVLGLAAVALAGSCKTEDSDPLSAVVIDGISQESGNANGTAWTGNYETRFELVECDCPEIDAEQDGMPFVFDICEAIDFSPEDGAAPLMVVQTDGFLAITLPDAGQMTGPINSDGGFSVASHINLDTLLFNNEFLGRIDGTFETKAGLDTFEGVYKQRVIADYVDQHIDCRTVFDLEGERDDTAQPDPP